MPSAPSAIGVQVPGVTSQTLQPLVQAVPQQKPSAQKPEAQVLLEVHGVPLGVLSTHPPSLQKKSEPHCEWALQDAGQVDAPWHRYGLQLGEPMMPAGLAAQVPTLPGRLQASQLSAQGVLQQTPSTQPRWPQSLLTAQAAPTPSDGLHMPASAQRKFSPQSVLVVQRVGQSAVAPVQA